MKTVIFDVDGTLVDSVDLHTQAWLEVLQEFGKPVTFEQVRFQIGKGGDQLLPVFLTEEEVKEHGEEISNRRTKLFHEKYMGKVRGLPGVRALFQHLLAEKKQLALASSAKGDELQTYKKLAGIDDLIETETSSDDAEKSKPEPDIFQAALQRLGHPSPAETIVIGDTPYDIEAAAKAGLRTIAVRSGGFPDETLKDAIAIYDDPADLLRHYPDSPLAH